VFVTFTFAVRSTIFTAFFFFHSFYPPNKKTYLAFTLNRSLLVKCLLWHNHQSYQYLLSCLRHLLDGQGER
jgi:hypothetical protein